MVDEGKIAQAVELLRRAASPSRIILFGSYARGEAHPDSDVDLLVVEREVPDAAAEMVRLSRVLSPLRLPVEILVVSKKDFDYWSATPGHVMCEAATAGKVLYEAA